MTTKKVLEVVSLYRRRFEDEGIPKKRMNIKRSLGSLTSADRLAHAHFLLDGIEQYAQQPEQEGKTGRHLASVQMILSFENWYTLEQLMAHNRPDAIGGE